MVKDMLIKNVYLPTSKNYIFIIIFKFIYNDEQLLYKFMDYIYNDLHIIINGNNCLYQFIVSISNDKNKQLLINIIDKFVQKGYIQFSNAYSYQGMGDDCLLNNYIKDPKKLNIFKKYILDKYLVEYLNFEFIKQEVLINKYSLYNYEVILLDKHYMKYFKIDNDLIKLISISGSDYFKFNIMKNLANIPYYYKQFTPEIIEFYNNYSQNYKNIYK